MYLLESSAKETSTNNITSNQNSNGNTSDAQSNTNLIPPVNYDLYITGVKSRISNLLNFIKNLDSQIEENKHIINLYDKLSIEDTPKKNERPGKFFKRKKIEKQSSLTPSENEIKCKTTNNNKQEDYRAELKKDLEMKSSKLEKENFGKISEKKAEYQKEKLKKEKEYNYMINSLNDQYIYYKNLIKEPNKFILNEKSVKNCGNVKTNISKTLVLSKYVIHDYYMAFYKVKKTLFNQQRGEFINRLMKEQEKRYNSINSSNYYSLNNNDKFSKTIKTRRKNSPSLNVNDKCVNSSTGNLFLMKK